MDITASRSGRPLVIAVLAALAAATVLLALTVPASAGTEDGERSIAVMAAEERERRPIAPTQRDQLGLVLYGLMGLAVVAGFATMRRQLKGERPQSDGEFRWR